MNSYVLAWILMIGANVILVQPLGTASEKLTGSAVLMLFAIFWMLDSILTRLHDIRHALDK
jgi:hypothetical protein